MAEERVQRRLAAILAADVVGYSRLMERDESDTFERLRAHRKELFEPEIQKHHGRVFKLMGDGLLAEFASVVDAVECAVSLQRGMTERNSGAREDRRIDMRIGVNLGDVIVEGEDRHGEGVNIAARLQQLAEPCGISVSRMVVENVKHKLTLRFESLGEHQVKNLTEPVHIYRVLLDPDEAHKSTSRQNAAVRSWRRPVAAVAALVLVVAAGAAAWWRSWEPRSDSVSVEHMALPLPDKPSIIVLPFVNMSSEADQEYFADGITEDLTTDLSRIAGLFVISRNTAFAYKGKAVQPAQVAEELGVRYILEGSVRRAGTEVRINAQLIDAISGGHVWADRYDGSLADIFALQDEVTGSIADALALRLTAAEQASLIGRETNAPAAYDAFLRGWDRYLRSTPDDYVAAIPYFEEAIVLDPEFGRAYAALALIYFSAYDRWWHESLGLTYAEAQEKARHYLAEAKKRPTSTSHQVAGSILRFQGQDEQALGEFRAAIALDPSDSWNYAFLAETLNSAGQPAEAVPNIHTAMRLDPRYPADFLRILGTAQFQLEQFPDAAVSLNRAAAMNPDDQWALALLIATYGYLARKDDAAHAIAQYNAAAAKIGYVPLTIADYAPEIGTVWWPAPPLPFSIPADRKRLTKGLKLAGVPLFLTKDSLGEKNKLTASELRSLVFGHKLRGHDYGYRIGADRFASVTSDGIANLSGNWGLWRDTAATIEGDQLCIRGQYLSDCFTAYRNPGGTKAKLNEYMFLSARDWVYMFSQVE